MPVILPLLSYVTLPLHMIAPNSRLLRSASEAARHCSMRAHQHVAVRREHPLESSLHKIFHRSVPMIPLISLLLWNKENQIQRVSNGSWVQSF